MDQKMQMYLIIGIFIIVLIAASYIAYDMGYNAGAIDALATPLNRPAPHIGT